MEPFSISDFSSKPSVHYLRNHRMRKDDWLAIAVNYDISVKKVWRKSQIKNFVINALVEEETLPEEAYDLLDEEGSQLTLKQLELQYAREKEERDRQERKEHEELERKERRERDELERKDRIEREEREHIYQLELLEKKRTIKDNVSQGDESEQVIDVVKASKMIQLFDEADPDEFFMLFERLALNLKWPKRLWPVILQPSLKGKARTVFLSLTSSESNDYDFTKDSILKAYELTAEYYRLKFRRCKKFDSHSYIEYSHNLVKLHDKWYTAASVTTLDEYRELILLEQFIRGVPIDVQRYLFEREVTTLQRAAVLAENYSLIKPHHHSQRQSKKSPGNVSEEKKSSGSYSKSLSEVRCYKCNQLGHMKARCPSNYKEGKSESSGSNMAIRKVQQEIPVSHYDRLDNEFAPFKFDGVVSVSDDLGRSVPVRIVRDTCSSNSLIVKGKVPGLEKTFTSDRLVVRSLGGLVTVPLCRLYLHCGLLARYVTVGVVDELPIRGVDFLMGNDLAGGKVVPSPIVVDTPLEVSPVEDPVLYPSCVLQRSRSLAVVKVPRERGTDVTKDVNVSTTSGTLGKDVVGTVDVDINIDSLFQTDSFGAQQEDFSLQSIYSEVVAEDQINTEPVCYYLRNGLLMRKFRSLHTPASSTWEIRNQIVIPGSLRQKVLHVAHISSSHLGIRKTLSAVLQLFYWPGIRKSVTEYCKSCAVCQLVGKPNQIIKPAPLQPIPVVPEPFDKVILDCVGPLPKKSQGALERFHQTLKDALTKYCQEHRTDWDEGLPFVLYAIRNNRQESLGYSPAELLYGRKVRGPLEILYDMWSDQTKEVTLGDYAKNLQGKLESSRKFAHDNLSIAQDKMKLNFDNKAKTRSFRPGESVLMLVPIRKTFENRYEGPYTVMSRNKDNYVISTPGKRKSEKMVHINLLKKFETQCDNVSLICKSTVEDNVKLSEIDFPDRSKCIHLNNTLALNNIDCKLNHLSSQQASDLKKLLELFPEICGDVPTQTSLVDYQLELKPGTEPQKSAPYRVSPQKRAILKKETDFLLQHGFAEPSISPWASPCVLVEKPDGSYRLCTDFRRLNEVTVSDSYPLPRVDDLIDQVSNAVYVTKIDLLRGYYQVPLADNTKPLTAFTTPDGLYQYTVLPFGLKNAPAVFQRLMDQVISNMPGIRVYLDDIVVFSDTWLDHLSMLKDLLSRLRQACLTINLTKSDFGHAKLQYLGYVIGSGEVSPVAAKIDAITKLSCPRSRREVRKFLGMVGYYRRFCKNFSEVVAPLTDLTSSKRKFVWTPVCEEAFRRAKDFLTSSPVLKAPDFGSPFAVEVDASDLGIGAVLLQKGPGDMQHPVAYMSKKLKNHQRNYSTIEKEALSLLTALEHFEVYLSGSPAPILVFTDHEPLKSIPAGEREFKPFTGEATAVLELHSGARVLATNVKVNLYSDESGTETRDL
ncbi:uncharacterized protein [Palaemon carinicauda]|uniref:uncharacterized protein n=1 Tax=Palaemon carinicauda TaxID=392227 RepID=UPI0035B61F10